jgi:hypothetical protein
VAGIVGIIAPEIKTPWHPPSRAQACAGLLPGAELAGTVQLWEWIGDEAATTFSY